MPSFETRITVSYLIKLAYFAVMEISGDVSVEDASFVVHIGILAGVVVRIPRQEVVVSSIGFP